MSNLSNFDPFNDSFDNLFRGFLRPVHASAEIRQLKLDVHEYGAAYTVTADLPGVNKDDIAVTVDGNRVTIEVENHSETKDKRSEQLLHWERNYGKVRRSFRLAQDIDPAAVTASYEDGVLTLNVPKQRTVTAHKISVT